MDQAKETASRHDSWLTMVAILDDGADLSQAISDLNAAGIDGEDLTVVLKRPDPDEPEPFPEGTRYVVVPDDSRGLGLTVGIAVVFVVSALLFAFTTPRIGLALFVFFISLAALLAVGSFMKVGVMPILIDVGAPAEESGFWNDEFERGKVLLFASTEKRRDPEGAWEIFRRRGIYFDMVGRRLTPQPVSGAVLHGATPEGGENRAEETRKA